jgi:hypothetical protein
MDRIFLYITADAYEMSIWRTEVGGTGTDKDAFVEELTSDLVAFFEQVPADLYPNIRKHAKVMAGGGPVARFELGLEMLVNGLDTYVGLVAYE